MYPPASFSNLATCSSQETDHTNKPLLAIILSLPTRASPAVTQITITAVCRVFSPCGLASREAVIAVALPAAACMYCLTAAVAENLRAGFNQTSGQETTHAFCSFPMSAALCHHRVRPSRFFLPSTSGMQSNTCKTCPRARNRGQLKR